MRICSLSCPRSFILAKLIRLLKREEREAIHSAVKHFAPLLTDNDNTLGGHLKSGQTLATFGHPARDILALPPCRTLRGPRDSQLHYS